jgi:hypothetical protein
MDLNSASSSTYTPVVAGLVGALHYSRQQLAARPSAPSQVTLVGNVLRNYTLIQPLAITLESADGSIIASDEVFHVYGEGDTRQESVEDYLSSLAEYYALLETCEDAPSVELFSYLQTYLRPKTI